MPLAKAFKRERTHEENQERAYIAASKRSDRSLEARVESARRASDIHKRRTGRALKVTEQDVINERLYKEEDELPAPYRRPAAPPQTSLTGFDRRLSACCTSHVATKSEVDQPIHNPCVQHSPKMPQYTYVSKSLSSSPTLMHQQQQQMSHQTPNSSNYQDFSYTAFQLLPIDSPIQYYQRHPAPISIYQEISPQSCPVMTEGYDRGELPGLGHGDASPLTESPELLSVSNAMLERYPLVEGGSCVSPFQESEVFMSSADTSAFSYYNLFSTTQHPEFPALLESTFDFNGPPTSMTIATANASGTYNDMNAHLLSTTEIGIYHPYLGFDDLDSAITISPSGQAICSLEDSDQSYSFFSSASKGRVPEDTPSIDGGSWNGLADWGAWHPST